MENAILNVIIMQTFLVLLSYSSSNPIVFRKYNVCINSHSHKITSYYQFIIINSITDRFYQFNQIGQFCWLINIKMRV